MKAMRIACLAAVLVILRGEDLRGVLTYSKAGVTREGRVTAWGKAGSIEETDPDWKAEHAKRAVADTASGRLQAAAWCRERGLEDEARAHLARAVELDPSREVAAERIAEERAKRKPADFAAWCRERALLDDEWAALVSMAVADPWDRAMIPRARERVALKPAVTKLGGPLAGRWMALADATGHHQAKVFAIHALDFMRIDADGRTHRGAGRALADYHGFDEPVYAAADGEVAYAEDRFADLPPGQGGKFDEANAVHIRHREAEYTLYAHLKKGSVTVKAGERVKRGQVIGRVGNSGASGLPHLHFTMDMPVRDATGGGWIGRPYRFEAVKLVEAFGVRCSVEVKLAAPRETWVFEFPAP